MFECLWRIRLTQESEDALRTGKRLSLIEIADRLALPKTTVYYWIRDLPLGRKRRSTRGKRIGDRGMRKKYRLLREAAHNQGLAECDELIKLPTFRDFVVLYIAKGYKRNRNSASICNSDPPIVAMAAAWLSALSPKRLIVRVQDHADQNADELRRSLVRLLQLIRRRWRWLSRRTATTCAPGREVRARSRERWCI